MTDPWENCIFTYIDTIKNQPHVGVCIYTSTIHGSYGKEHLHTSGSQIPSISYKESNAFLSKIYTWPENASKWSNGPHRFVNLYNPTIS